jgi:hypothetical protein
MARADTDMGRAAAAGHPSPTRTETAIAQESELGSDMAGNDQLQGGDRGKLHDEKKMAPEKSAGCKRARVETR